MFVSGRDKPDASTSKATPLSTVERSSNRSRRRDEHGRRSVNPDGECTIRDLQRCTSRAHWSICVHCVANYRSPADEFQDRR